MTRNPLIWALIVFLAITVAYLVFKIWKEIRDERRDREQAFAPRVPNTGRDDSAIPGDASDCRPATLARLVEKVSGRQSGSVITDTALAIALAVAVLHIYAYVEKRDEEAQAAREQAVKLVNCEERLNEHQGRVELVRADGKTRVRCGRV